MSTYKHLRHCTFALDKNIEPCTASALHGLIFALILFGGWVYVRPFGRSLSRANSKRAAFFLTYVSHLCIGKLAVWLVLARFPIRLLSLLLWDFWPPLLSTLDVFFLGADVLKRSRDYSMFARGMVAFGSSALYLEHFQSLYLCRC